MGEIVRSKKLSISRYMYNPFAVILCNLNVIDDQAIIDSGFRRIALNYLLATALLFSKAIDRKSTVREQVFELLPRHSAVYLVDYEMLFDPRYGLDVLRLFGEIARRQKLVVKWCGRLTAQMLVYAEPGYPEFREYPIAEYDITCIS